jgi:hypothetical protein
VHCGDFCLSLRFSFWTYWYPHFYIIFTIFAFSSSATALVVLLCWWSVLDLVVMARESKHIFPFLFFRIFVINCKYICSGEHGGYSYRYHNLCSVVVGCVQQ